MSNQSYRVKAGDTLSRIARKVRSTVATLATLNRLRDPNRIRAGQVLRLPECPGAKRLGQLSRKYEVGDRGPGTVSSGRGDPGGISYGCYQLATRQGRPQQFLDAEGAPWAKRFAGMIPGSAAFSAEWRACAADDAATFEAAQHTFIERTHYAPQAALLLRKAGFDLARRSRALREVVWSVAVQHGPASGVVLAALRSVAEDADDAAIIRAVYAERGRRRADGTLAYFGKSGLAVQDGVARRFASECADAIALLAADRA